MRSLRVKALAALASVLVVAASANTGFIFRAGGPTLLPLDQVRARARKARAVLARLAPPRRGAERCPRREVVTLHAEGPAANPVIGGTSTTLEARSPRGWSAYDYPWTTPGAPDQDGLGSALTSAGVAMILVGFQERMSRSLLNFGGGHLWFKLLVDRSLAV